MKNLGLLVIRLTTGLLLAGHGAQKLFGWFSGYGREGTGGWLESMGLRPGDRWALAVGVGEFGGGLLIALGLLHPVGPLLTMGPMAVATGTVHKGRPIWVSEGGAELPVTNLAIAAGLTLAGPGRLSLDRLLGIRVPGVVTFLTAASVGAGIVLAVSQYAQAHPTKRPVEEARAEPAGEEGEEPRRKTA